MRKQLFEDAETVFKTNCQLVLNLAGFDRVVLDFVDKILQNLPSGKDTFAPNPIQNALSMIKNIRTNKSLRHQYVAIYNQCVVLLVSHFASALHGIFKQSVSAMLPDKLSEALKKEELKLTVKELSLMEGGHWGLVSEALIRKRDFSFQDMQSVSKAFSTYCDYTPEKTKDVNNIIVGQACRHVIVHAGAIVDSKCIKQVASAFPRELEVQLKSGKPVQFEREELAVLAESMKAYVQSMTTCLRKQLARPNGEDSLSAEDTW